jgi:chromosome segregation ATPase
LSALEGELAKREQELEQAKSELDEERTSLEQWRGELEEHRVALEQYAESIEQVEKGTVELASHGSAVEPVRAESSSLEPIEEQSSPEPIEEQSPAEAEEDGPVAVTDDSVVQNSAVPEVVVDGPAVVAECEAEAADEVAPETESVNLDELDDGTRERLRVLRRIKGPNMTDADLLEIIRAERDQPRQEESAGKKKWWGR